MSIQVHLHQFEGPLSLLLYLIRREEMDILNINVHQITRQYLDYIKKMKEFDLEVAGDFVAMAATLLQIKSQMLLPQYGAAGETLPEDDPRRELVNRLLEYQAYQNASQKLYSRPLLGRDLWSRGKREEFVLPENGDIVVDDNPLFAMISMYRRALRNMTRTVHRVAHNTLSIAGRILQIRELLKVGERSQMSLLITETGGAALRYQLLITFISLLELAKMGFVSIFQSEDGNDIHVNAVQVIERNVIDRVEEYDSSHSEQVAATLMDQAEQDAEIRQVTLDEDDAASPDETEIASDEDIEAAEQILATLEANDDVSIAQEADTSESPTEENSHV